MYSQAPQSGLASLLASRGRGEDTMLVHMTPGEVQALQGIASAAGGSLTLNPSTGLPEAGFLKELLPTIAGSLLKTVFPGMGELGIGLLTAGVTGLMKGDLEKGITAGMGAYSGAKLTSGLTQLGRENIASKELARRQLADTAKLARKEFGLEPIEFVDSLEGVKAANASTLADLGIKPKGLEAPGTFGMRAYGAPVVKTPGTIGLRPVSETIAPVDLSGIGEGISREVASKDLDRPTRGELMEGIRGLFGKGGLERFQSAVGGPMQLGYTVSPILGALQRAETEKAQRKFARSQTPNYYYVPGEFDFESGTFAPGGYYTAPGQPYTPKIGFADGGVVFQEGGETETEALKQYYQGLLTPPDTSQGDARRADTLAYISALNEQLKKPTVGDASIAPPWAGNVYTAGTPGGGSSIGNQGQPIGPGLPGGLPPTDMGGPLIGFDPSAGVGLPGQTLDEFLREGRTSVEEPVAEKPAEEKPEEESKQESSPLREGVGAVGSAVTTLTDPLLNLYDKLPDYLRTLAPGYLTVKGLDEVAEAAKKFGIVVPGTPDLEEAPIEMVQAAPLEVTPPDPFLMDLLRNLEKRPEDPEGRIIIEELSMPGDITQGGTFDPGSVITPDIGAPSWMDPYNPLENPFEGGIGLGQQSGAMGPDYNFGFAAGGAVPRMQYAAGGKLLNGPGDGMSDDIKANIDGEQEARLADGEFVIPADVVSHLGNGSTKAGAQKLYAMMDRVRKARTGTTKQGREIKPNKFLPA